MHKADELQKAILNNIPDQAWLKDGQSRYILVNEAFMAACGLPEQAILNRTPVDVWPADWGQEYIDTDQEVIRLGQRLRYEERRLGADGSPRWFDTIKTPVRNEQGEVIGTTGISRDITDRKQAEQALARLNRLYAVRSKTNQAIVRIADRDRLFGKVCQIAVQSGGLQLAWMGLFDEQASAPVKPVACFSDQPSTRRKWMRQLGVDVEVNFSAVKERSFKHLVCNSAASAKRLARHADTARSMGFASFAAFPLAQGGHHVGLFVLYSAEAQFFTDDIVRLLGALATDLSFALDFIAEAQQRCEAEQQLRESRGQLRELAAYLQSVREEERTRISRELHDELGQSLTAIRIGLGVIETKGKAMPAEWLDNVHALKKIADSTVESVQRIAADLRPLILDELGLPSAIDWLLESFSANAGVAYELLLPASSLDFSREISTTIFRIIQEALTNVSRHSQATRVVVELKETPASISLKITDDGKGIDPAADAREQSLGLIGMRERAYLLGGDLRIHSRPGAGTSIEVRIPTPSLADSGAPQ
jgi:PAS domain S-box-containing protein